MFNVNHFPQTIAALRNGYDGGVVFQLTFFGLTILLRFFQLNLMLRAASASLSRDQWPCEVPWW